jgi:hypothetical protein
LFTLRAGAELELFCLTYWSQFFVEHPNLANLAKCDKHTSLLCNRIACNYLSSHFKSTFAHKH